MATAAPHHGQAYGSLVMVDPQVEDDDAMIPVKRITPEVAFPESQGGAKVYGTAWPLSDNYFLCVYDVKMKRGMGRQGGKHLAGNYGIYLIDGFGNKELLYRDPAIACLSPMPLRPRKKPPVVPSLADQNRRHNPSVVPSVNDKKNAKPAEGTIAVINVYDSLKPWPDGTQIKSLRVLQVLPMTVPSGPLRPHEIGLRLPSAGDSVNPVRHVLGTIPVESDGSAHFTVPAFKEIFFQALDERGLAIQSMRSATYLQAGEKLVCQGCHDRRNQAPPVPKSTPLALLRAPSKLKPDVDGSKPFSYPRLVQPVLDKHCVSCHVEKKAIDLSGKIKGKFYASYVSLAPKYGFHNYKHGYRTTPGQFGAKASRLFKILEEGHYDVKLSAEELHRITLWLDCSSLFYGVYEKKGGQAQLRGEIAKPTLQ